MTAKIIEENTTPFQIVDVDPITLDLVENGLRNARFEMDAVLFRTAMSPGIREQHDEFPIIANRDGKMVVGQLGSFIHGFLEAYEGTVEDGDVFLMSDPYACNGAVSHLNDWLVLMPMYKDGRIISWSAMFGHMSDIGGKTPGSLPTDARQIYEEGIIIPPVKLYRKGEYQSDIMELILRNCRLPHWNRSDLTGIVAASRVAQKRVNEMADRFGEDIYHSALEELLERNKRAMRQLIVQNIPEEKVYFEDFICDDGIGMGPYKLACHMWREGDTVIFDFGETDPQSEGSVNMYLNEEMFKMFVGVFMIMVFDPQILFNDGFYDLVDVRIQEGSFLKPRHPAALSCRTHALGRVMDLLNGLLGQSKPEFLCAAGMSDSPHFFYSGYDKRGEWFQLYQISFGGVPAKPIGDGPDGHSLWPTFTNVPNEFLESYFPLRIDFYETVADTGGPGFHRGGNALRIGYRFLEPGEISVHDDRWLTYPWGVNGGLPGGRSSKTLERRDGTVEHLTSKCDRIKVEEGDLLHFVTWGGGGWGDPFTRDADLVALDVRRGLVSADGAGRYGVVLNQDQSVDQTATEALRVKMTHERGETQVFDKGGTIAELKARCKEETGFEPPEAPRFNVRGAARAAE